MSDSTATGPTAIAFNIMRRRGAGRCRLRNQDRTQWLRAQRRQRLSGGGFFLLHDAKNNRDVFIDARETAPESATPQAFLDPGQARLVLPLIDQVGGFLPLHVLEHHAGGEDQRGGIHVFLLEADLGAKEALEHDFHLLIKPVVPNKLRAMIAFKLGRR